MVRLRHALLAASVLSVLAALDPQLGRYGATPAHVANGAA